MRDLTHAAFLLTAEQSRPWNAACTGEIAIRPRRFPGGGMTAMLYLLSSRQISWKSSK